MTAQEMGKAATQPKIFPLQLIVVAMIAGLVAVTGIARWLVGSGRMSTSPHLIDILLTVLAIYSLSVVLAFVVVKKILSRRFRGSTSRIDAERPSAEAGMELFTQITIIGAAFTEGCGLFGAISHLLSGSWLALFFPVICVVIFLVRFPTRRRYVDFLATVGAGALSDAPIDP